MPPFPSFFIVLWCSSAGPPAMLPPKAGWLVGPGDFWLPCSPAIRLVKGDSTRADHLAAVAAEVLKTTPLGDSVAGQVRGPHSPGLSWLLCSALANFALIWSTHCCAALELGHGVNAH